MTAATPTFREHGNAYNIFILVLTIFSLALMVLTPPPAERRDAGARHVSTTTRSA